MAATELLGILLQVRGRLHRPSAKPALKRVIKELSERPLGNRLMNPSIVSFQVKLELQRAMNRAEISINNPESSHKGKNQWTDQAVVSDRWLIAERSSACRLVWRLSPGVRNGIEVLPTHRRDKSVQFLKRVEVPIEVTHQDSGMIGEVKRFCHARSQDG
jgi:hypothetical protein